MIHDGILYVDRVCSRPKCMRLARYKDGNSFYCLRCRRVRQMVMSARRRYPHLSITREQVEARLPSKLICQLCGKRMSWGCKGRHAPKANIITIQHWHNGSWTFLCHSCNCRDTGRKRLTTEDVLHIRSQRGQQGTRALGRRFGVHPTYISAIQLRKNWRHV